MTDGEQTSTVPDADLCVTRPAKVRALPQSFVDAGDLPWPELEPVLRRAPAGVRAAVLAIVRIWQG
jgi:hypothetical protein